MVTRRSLLKGFAAGALVYSALPCRWLAAREQPASGDIAFFSASRLSELIHRREIGALELLDLYLERIQRFNPPLNAVIWLDSSFGLIPYQGHIPPLPGVSTPPEMAVIGPLARSAEDLELILTVLTEPIRSEGPQPELPPARGRRLQDYRVATWLTDPYSEIDRAVRIALQRAVEALRRAEVPVNEQARPDLTLAESHGVYRGLVQKVFRGYAPPDIGGRQQSLRQAWQAFFQDYDVLLAPVAPVVAFPHDHHQPMKERHLRVNGAEVDYLFGLSVWMSLASAAYLPATTAPIGLSPMGLPVGIQIIGPYRGDRSTLAFARLMSEVVGGFRAPPGY